MLRRGGSNPLRPTNFNGCDKTKCMVKLSATRNRASVGSSPAHIHHFGRLAESSLKHLGANETGQKCPTGEQSPHLPPF